MNKDLIQKIEFNLYTLYEKMAALSGNLIWTRGEVNWVDCHPQPWPKTIFGTPSGGVDFESLIAAIKKGEVPPHWILRQKDDEGAFHRQLKANGFRLMTQWPGMAIDLEDTIFEKGTVQEVMDANGLDDWLDIINQTLFLRNSLDRKVMQTCLESKEAIYFYIQKIDGKAVCSGLSFDTEDTTGLYMIATLESHRKKGLGAAMTKHMLWAAQERGQKKAILQATPMGAKLYPKLGFETFCMFDIYWLLGQR